MPSLLSSLGALSSFGRFLARVVGAVPLTRDEDPEAAALVRRADDAYRAGRRDDARRLYREALQRRRDDLAALRGLRTRAVDAGSWGEALSLEGRIIGQAPAGERAREA